jgi:uncharacterized iron-regulated membrane protein
MTVAALFFLYVATTGIIIQLIDMKAIYSGAPASDPNMQSIREGIMGPPGFALITTADYTALPLPADADAQKMLETTRAAARQVVPTDRIKWVELRMDGSVPVGIVAFAGAQPQQLKFNALTGSAMGTVPDANLFERGPPSAHDLVKNLHRGNVIGPVGAWVDLVVGLALLFMVISGLSVYFKMLGSRIASGRNSWFWR